MKTKVLHITQSLGGVRTYLQNIFSHSDQEKFDYVIIAPEHFEFQEFCKEKTVTYYPIKIQRSINFIKDIRTFLQLLSILKSEKTDIIQTHSAKGGFLGRLAGKFYSAKVIYTPHAFSYLSFKGIKRMIFYFLESVSISWSDVLLSVSYSEANRAIYELGYDEQKIKVILNAVPVSDTLPFRNYHKCLNIGMIGRLTYQKNPILFLSIAKDITERFPYIVFSILGAGMTDHLSCEIETFLTENDLKENVKILSWGDEETSRKFLFNTDIFVMTSVFEGLPFSLIEAMSLGLPCVVSKVDGNTDVIQNYENGFSCITKNEFNEKLSLLIQNEDLRRTMGYAGYKYVKNKHEISKGIEQIEQLYIDLALGKAINRSKDNGFSNNNITENGMEINLKVSPSI